MSCLWQSWLIGFSIVLLIILAQTPGALAERPPASAKNVTPVGHLDIDGGGIVQVHGNYAYIGHMEAGAKGGTSIVDVSNPKSPRDLREDDQQDDGNADQPALPQARHKDLLSLVPYCLPVPFATQLRGIPSSEKLGERAPKK